MTFEGNEMAALRDTASKILLVVLWPQNPRRRDRSRPGG
jgi:hypothetical protein